MVEASALAPKSNPSADKTMVLPAPVSPVRTVKPFENSRVASPMTPRSLIEISSIIYASGPRHPATGKPNLLTNRLVNGESLKRTILTDCEDLLTSTRDPGASS